jgi:hypothetical protein
MSEISFVYVHLAYSRILYLENLYLLFISFLNYEIIHGTHTVLWVLTWVEKIYNSRHSMASINYFDSGISKSTRVITKLPNSEQSYKGKVKTHKNINRQNQSTTGNCENRNDHDLVQSFLKKWWAESDFKASNLPLSLRLKVSGCHYNSIYNNTWTKQVK